LREKLEKCLLQDVEQNWRSVCCKTSSKTGEVFVARRRATLEKCFVARRRAKLEKTGEEEEDPAHKCFCNETLRKTGEVFVYKTLRKNRRKQEKRRSTLLPSVCYKQDRRVKQEKSGEEEEGPNWKCLLQDPYTSLARFSRCFLWPFLELVSTLRSG
jgi:hypothetical protein